MKNLPHLEKLIQIIERIISLNQLKISEFSNKKNSWEIRLISDSNKKLLRLKTRTEQRIDEIKSKSFNGRYSDILMFGEPIMRSFENLMFYEVYFNSNNFLLEDISYAYGLSIGDVKDIALQVKDKTALVKYLPSLILRFEKTIIPNIKNHLELSAWSTLVEESISTSKKKWFYSANTLLLSIIEGIVRVSAKHAIEKQGHPHKQDEFHSLERLILGGYEKDVKKIKWNEEIIPGKEDLYLHQKNTRMLFENEEERFEIFKTSEIKTYTSFTSRFSFLLNNYKEERNFIVHGAKTDFGQQWRFYLLLSALDRVITESEFYIH